jgi:hypothetical protein
MKKKELIFLNVETIYQWVASDFINNAQKISLILKLK